MKRDQRHVRRFDHSCFSSVRTNKQRRRSPARRRGLGLQSGLVTVESQTEREVKPNEVVQMRNDPLLALPVCLFAQHKFHVTVVQTVDGLNIFTKRC